MVRSKIIVLSMRDEWHGRTRTDSWRRDGIRCYGHDRCHVVVAHVTGYHDAINIVEYHSAVVLLDKITYYLDNPPHDAERIAIATQGRTLAMTRHRSWHRMEEIIFGRIMSLS
mmetsp:Transcript_9738/g.10483  ORF Transcript_9738/g.10483 Transcript_9738/m.10483 type:complete len:113 (+) Transcript_9738:150-488(+)